MMPFAKMAVYSFCEFAQVPQVEFSIVAIERALTQHYGNELTRDKWGSEFAKWVCSNDRLMSVFYGEEPFVSKNLKALANVGSQLFDILSAVFATAYRIGNPKRTRSECAPNGTLRGMYDFLIKYHSVPNKNDCLTRQWNNKGNSLESLAMVMFEENQYPLLWYTGFICFHASYQGTSLPNIRTI
jgi:hypothetical protein